MYLFMREDKKDAINNLSESLEINVEIIDNKKY